MEKLSPRYSDMTYRRCGRSGLVLPALSLGLWHNFGEPDDPRTARETALAAFEAGITHFDLANNYGPPPGAAEITLGNLFKNDLHPYRDELIISTKAGYKMWDGPYGDWGSRKYLAASLDQSLKRMGLDYVDIFYHHRPDPDTPLEETMGALDHFVRQGKALYAGISNYPAEMTLQAANILKELGTPCLIHQAGYSMLNRSIEDSLIDVLTEQGIGCIAFSPLYQGLLTDKYLSGIPENSRAAKPHGFLQREDITVEVVDRIRALNKIALSRGQSLAQMAIAWILRHEIMVSVLAGASSVRQLEENIQALENTDFSDEELFEIDSILAGQ